MLFFKVSFYEVFGFIKALFYTINKAFPFTDDQFENTTSALPVYRFAKYPLNIVNN